MRIRKPIGIMLSHLQHGRMIVSNAQWAVSMLILAKLYNLSEAWFPVIIVLSLVIVLVIGWASEKLNIKKHFQQNQFKYLKGE